MYITQTPIRQLVAEHPASIAVFERFQIDLCDLGEMSLAAACAARSLSLEQVEEKLAAILPAESGAGDPSSLPLLQLIQRIVRVHHRSVRQDLPGLLRLADRLVVHRDLAPSLRRKIETLHAGLLRHIDAEEQSLFPVIARLGEADAEPFATTTPLKRNMLQMQQDHDSAVDTMDELRAETKGFTPPPTACATHRALLSGLDAFDRDLRSHLQLEDNILFPRALALQASLPERSEA